MNGESAKIVLAVFFDVQGDLCQFHLLDDVRCKARGSQSPAAVGANLDAMVEKLYALLKNDPALGQDILASREAIWDRLSEGTMVASLD